MPDSYFQKQGNPLVDAIVGLLRNQGQTQRQGLEKLSQWGQPNEQGQFTAPSGGETWQALEDVGMGPFMAAPIKVQKGLKTFNVPTREELAAKQLQQEKATHELQMVHAREAEQKAGGPIKNVAFRHIGTGEVRYHPEVNYHPGHKRFGLLGNEGYFNIPITSEVQRKALLTGGTPWEAGYIDHYGNFYNRHEGSVKFTPDDIMLRQGTGYLESTDMYGRGLAGREKQRLSGFGPDYGHERGVGPTGQPADPKVNQVIADALRRRTEWRGSGD